MSGASLLGRDFRALKEGVCALVQGQKGTSDWATLMCRVQLGDSNAYRELLQELAPPVRGFLSSKLRNKQDIDEVLQETLMAVHRARHTYRPGTPFAPWVWSIAHYKWVDWMRKQGRSRRLNKEMAEQNNLHSQQSDEVGRVFGESDSRGYLEDDLENALRELKPPQRRAIELMKLGGLSAGETAAAMGVTVSNVKVLAHRGYIQLRQRLKGRMK